MDATERVPPKTTRDALLFHSVERLLEKLQIRHAAGFFASTLDPFFLESILCRSVILIKHPKYSGEWELRQFVSGELVGDVVPQLVLGRVVPFLLLDHFETAAFLRIGWIEYVREKFDAFGQAFDDGEALVIERAFDHFHHVLDLRAVGARGERGSAS